MPSPLAAALDDLRDTATTVRGCEMLHKLCFQRPAYKRAAVAAGALPLLASALGKATAIVSPAPGAPGRRCACCKTIRTLSFRDPKLKDAAGTAGCVEATAAALSACGQKLAEEALWTLSSLCANHPANVARAQSCGALIAVMTCQRVHAPTSSAVKAKAMMLFALLS